MPIRYVALSTADATALRHGAPDAYGRAPERVAAEGAGNPCRHCLGFVPEGRPMLVLAHRPFPALQPYAETGPIFLCADPCARFEDGVPGIFADTPDYLLKGYSPDHRIVYGTGGVVPTERIALRAETVFEDPRVAYIHLRSARNNCYQLRIERAA